MADQDDHAARPEVDPGEEDLDETQPPFSQQQLAWLQAQFRAAGTPTPGATAAGAGEDGAGSVGCMQTS